MVNNGNNNGNNNNGNNGQVVYSVPDGGSTALLLGTGLVVLVLANRRFARVR